MATTQIVAHDETDGLYDTSPVALAARFGRRTREWIALGQDPFLQAMIAAHFAGQVIDREQKVIGRITPSEPWGVSERCDACDGYALPEHRCPNLPPFTAPASSVCRQCNTPLSDDEDGPECGRCKDSDLEADQVSS